MSNSQSPFRVGIGFDAHEFGPNRKLILGGVEIPSDVGLVGHSDGDVLLHAVTDALLGALALPDIGTRFPDTDPAWLDADSSRFLQDAYREIRGDGYRVVNLDCVLVCDRPALAPHVPAISSRIAALLEIERSRVGVKAKTTEGTMLAVKDKSIAALVTVLVCREQT